MNLIKLYKILLFNYIKIWSSSSKFESCIHFISLFITFFSTALIIIIISVNQGFKDNIIEVLEDLNGTYRVYNNEYLNNSDYELLKKEFPNTSISAVAEKKCIVKFHENIEGVILNSSDKYLINKSINRFITYGYYSDSTIIIGELLKNKLNICIDDKVFLLSFKASELDEINSIKVSGFFKTNIPDYDGHMIFSGISNELFFSTDPIYNYFRIDNDIDTSYFSNSRYNLLNSFELNSSFHLWLSSYDNPIKILIAFLFIISLLNIINNSYYLVYYKQDQIKILTLLGLNKKNLKYIIILRSVILSSISAILGLLLAYSLLLMENTLHFIKLPEHVYFIDYIPISIQYNFIFIILLYVVFVSFLSSFLNFNIMKSK
jgi:lipoprotein-releasing system permease protein